MAIERYDLSGTPVLTEQLETGDTVTVTVYEKDGSVVPLDTNSATENVASSGKYDYTLDFTAKPSSGFNYYDIKFAGSLQTVWKSFSWDEDVTKYQGAVYIDTTGVGTAGTAYPIGTPETPVDNLTDALAIATRVATTEFKVRGTLTLDQSVASKTFDGRTNKSECIVVLNNQDITGTNFTNVTLRGACNGQFFAVGCYMENMTNVSCLVERCQLLGSFTVDPTDGMFLWEGTSRGSTPIQVDLNGTGSCALAEFHSQVIYSNMTSPAAVIVQTGKVLITVNSSVTNGFMYFGGIGSVTDNKTGGVKIQYVLPQSVYDVSASSHTTAGTFGKFLNDNHQVLTGRWLLDENTNTMIFYDTDGTTPLFTFDMKDVNGNPAVQNVFERDPQ